MGIRDPSKAKAVIVPEKGIFGREVENGLSSRFWGSQTSSASSLDSLVALGPGEPAPLPLLAPSGVSRSQLLVAAQAVRLPGMPAYTEDQGGVVVDRAILHTGGDHWWANMSARMKAQKVLQQRKWSALKDAGNYSLCANFKSSISRSDIFKAKIEVEPFSRSVAAVHDDQRPEQSPGGEVAEGDAATASSSTATAAETGSGKRHLRTHSADVAGIAQYRRQLGGAELCARVGVNERQLTSGGAADGANAAALRTPLSVSVDLASSRAAAGGTSWLQYRLGLLQVSLPASSDGAADNGRQLQSVLHGQAGVAVQGTKSLWQTVPTHRLRRGEGRGSRAAAEQDKGELSPPQPAALFPSRVAAPRRKKNAAALRRQGAKRGEGEADGGGGLLAGLMKAFKAGTAEQGGDAASSAQGPAAMLKSLRRVSGNDSEVLIVPEEVQESIQDTSHTLQQLTEDVKGLTEWVTSGGMLTQLQRISGKVNSSGIRPDVPSKPWSAFVPSPHLKLGGLLGIAAGAPLLRQDRAHAASAIHTGGAEESADASAASAGGGGGGSKRAAWKPALAWVGDHVGQARLQPFATLVASGQVGRFQRPVLDFTRVIGRLDLGLAGSRAERAPGHPALALASSGTWHALTLSACQQLIGPVRICAELRFALDSEVALRPADGGSNLGRELQRVGQSGGSFRQRVQSAGRVGKEGVAALAGHAQGMRPTLMEAVYALDLAVPGSAGAARLVAWYAPMRKEGMVELRLF